MDEVGIEAEGLRKSFGDARALDGIDLHVEAGTFIPLSVRVYRRTA
jgi:ABC-type sugar transport system ATPase subunit